MSEETKNEFEAFEIKKVKRNDIKNAPYNPRYITDNNFDGLKKAIKRYGLHTPITINKRTGNVVVGNQRLTVLDTLHARKKDKNYDLTVAVIDVSKEEEVQHNVINNNPSIQGEYDKDLLIQLKSEFPEIDFKTDLFFDKYDMDFIFASDTDMVTEELNDVFSEEIEQDKPNVASQEDIQKIKEAKKEERAKRNEDFDDSASGQQAEQDNYMLTLVFNSNKEKMEALKHYGFSNDEKYIKASDFLSKVMSIKKFIFRKDTE